MNDQSNELIWMFLAGTTGTSILDNCINFEFFFYNLGRQSPYTIDFEHYDKHYFVLPINNKDKWYRTCNRQINQQWKRIRTERLKTLEHSPEMPPSLIIASGENDRVQVIALCSISKIPSCARRCLLEVIATQEYLYYLNIEHIFVALRDQHVFRAKFRFSFTRARAYGAILERNEPRGVSKFILASEPHRYVVQRYESSEEELYARRQNCYYYYYYNEEEDDDTYQDYYSCKKRIAYDVSARAFCYAASGPLLTFFLFLSPQKGSTTTDLE